MQPPTNERTRLCKDGFSSLHTYSRNSDLYGVCCCCYGYGFCPESFSWLSLCSSCHVILTVHISILTFREQHSSQQSLESSFDTQSSQAPSSARKNQQVVLNGIIRYMDHKNVVHDPTVKSCVVQVAANVARQIRSVASFSDVGCISDLLRHLRKSLQSIAGPIGEEEANLDIHLQNSIESCLLEIAKGKHDQHPQMQQQ